MFLTDSDLIPRKSFNKTKEAQKNLREMLLGFWKNNTVIFDEGDLDKFWEFHSVWTDATHGWGEVFSCNKVRGWENISISSLKANLCYMDSEAVEIDIPDTADYENPVYDIGELWKILLEELENKVFDKALKNIIGKSPEFEDRSSPEARKV